MSAASAILVSDLGKQFGSVRAVDRLSFDVHAGEIFGLVGPMALEKPQPFACWPECSRPTPDLPLSRVTM